MEMPAFMPGSFRDKDESRSPPTQALPETVGRNAAPARLTPACAARFSAERLRTRSLSSIATETASMRSAETLPIPSRSSRDGWFAMSAAACGRRMGRDVAPIWSIIVGRRARPDGVPPVWIGSIVISRKP